MSRIVPSVNDKVSTPSSTCPADAGAVPAASSESPPRAVPGSLAATRPAQNAVRRRGTGTSASQGLAVVAPPPSPVASTQSLPAHPSESRG